ncbi:MAG TPA: HD domain-containing protein [Candidatus Bathyarchaeia archaeon]|nr:HD domain-containing protein [Candidatus Bathyarchaeia archaeon]HLP49007.1 HD domain-containing protein [Candidatus Kapabacteria bacterium]
MSSIIEKAKSEFLKMISDFGSDPYHLLPHVPEAEKWSRFMLKKNPEAYEEVVLLAVWLHDFGHYPLPTDIDHAVRGEERAREFLERENYPRENMEKVLHCVRAHRCKDVMPETLEAKIIAFCDSASHMTDTMYLDMVRTDEEGKFPRTYAKMERDFRDLAIFPEVQKELAELYETWKGLLKAYEKLDFDKKINQ